MINLEVCDECHGDVTRLSLCLSFTSDKLNQENGEVSFLIAFNQEASFFLTLISFCIWMNSVSSKRAER
jgi:hypothetical protein